MLHRRCRCFALAWRGACVVCATPDPCHAPTSFQMRRQVGWMWCNGGATTFGTEAEEAVLSRRQLLSHHPSSSSTQAIDPDNMQSTLLRRVCIAGVAAPIPAYPSTGAIRHPERWVRRCASLATAPGLRRVQEQIWSSVRSMPSCDAHAPPAADKAQVQDHASHPRPELPEGDSIVSSAHSLSHCSLADPPSLPSGIMSSLFGVSAGVFALFFFNGVPRIREDILEQMPFIGDYFHHEIPPEDNPF